MLKGWFFFKKKIKLMSESLPQRPGYRREKKWMRLQLYRLRNAALAPFVVDVFAVLVTCMSGAVLQIFGIF